VFLKVLEEQKQATAEKSTGEWRGLLREILETVGLALLLYLGINIVSARVRVDGYSMIPTLQNNELLVVYRWAYHFGNEPRRGDIIIFDSVNRPDDELIKRIIGLPGDEVEIRSGQVLVNGEPLMENYIAAPPVYSGIWQVGEDSLFVLGDNRNDSSDSHVWGLLPMKDVIGKAVFAYWPLHEIGIINSDLAYAEIK
jgi:signal peptidase I